MDSSKIGVRYARALFGVAQEKGLAEPVRKDLELVISTLHDEADLAMALNNPVIKPSAKVKLLETVFHGNLQDVTRVFLSTLIQNRRESFLGSVARHYYYLYRTSRGLKPATIKTAGPLNDQTRKEMLQLIKVFFKTEVELTEEADPAVIGGFVLTVDDMQLDASISSGLQRIKSELSQKIR